MADVWSKKKRSEVMSMVRSRGNKETELVLVKIFRRNGISGWRRHTSIFGKPDFTFRKHRVTVFVDGCFWHGCPKHGRKPKSNKAFWNQKLAANKARDKLVSKKLELIGWHVLRIWEHELAKPNLERLLSRIRRALSN